VNPRNTEVAVGESAVLECRSPRGLPEPDIKWKKGGEFIETDGRLKIQEPGNLLIQDARKHDSGTYVCVAQNKAGEKESIPARLFVRGQSTVTCSCYVCSDAKVTEGSAKNKYKVFAVHLLLICTQLIFKCKVVNIVI